MTVVGVQSETGQASYRNSACDRSVQPCRGSPMSVTRSTVLPRSAMLATFAALALAALALAPAAANADVYWTNFAGGTIGRANLDGSGVNQSFITGADAPVRHRGRRRPHLLGERAARHDRPRQPRRQRRQPSFITGASAPWESRSTPATYPTSSELIHAPIAPGSSCTAEMRFAPQAQGARAATLTALTNAPSDTTTSLTGTAGPLPKGPPGPGERPGGTQRSPASSRRRAKPRSRSPAR